MNTKWNQWCNVAAELLKHYHPGQVLNPTGRALMIYYFNEGFSPYNAVCNLNWFILTGMK